MWQSFEIKGSEGLSMAFCLVWLPHFTSTQTAMFSWTGSFLLEPVAISRPSTSLPMKLMRSR